MAPLVILEQAFFLFILLTWTCDCFPLLVNAFGCRANTYMIICCTVAWQALLRSRNGTTTVHDGFPLLLVVMVALISLTFGYLSQ